MNLLLKSLITIGLSVNLVSCGSKTVNRTSRSQPRIVKKVVQKFAINFEQTNSLSSVLEKASKENKLVFVDIYTDWCTPCKLMDKDVFTDQSTADYINKNFISYKVNAEKANGPDLSVIFGVQVYPTLLFLNEKGQVLSRKDGAAYHSELIRLANDALHLQAGI